MVKRINRNPDAKSRFNAFMHLRINLPARVEIITAEEGTYFRIKVEAGPAQIVTLELTNVRDTQVREHVGTFTEGEDTEHTNDSQPKKVQPPTRPDKLPEAPPSPRGATK